ncbi:37602_t:CDS:2, partial [Gigaspora margarita]
SNRDFAKVFKAFANQHKTPDKIEEISLYNFLLFCQETLAKKSETLTWEDKSSVHQEYYNGIKKKIENSRKIPNWGKLVKEDLETVLEKYKNVYTKGYYLILQFWANVAAIHYNRSKNYESLIANVQVLISSYEDVHILKCIADYVSKLSDQQIRNIILKSEERIKSKVINNYIMSQNSLPLWFSEGLKKLENYKAELFKVPIMNPIFCNIIDISKFGAKIWHQIFDKKQIKLLFPDKIFEFSPQEYDNIDYGIRNALVNYKMDSESTLIIEINGFQKLEGQMYFDILELCPEHETKCSFERRSWHHCPPYDIFDIPNEQNDKNIIVEKNIIIQNQINEEPIILLSNATVLLNEDPKPGITYIRVYSKKVDTALTYTYKENNLVYFLIVEAKLPHVPFHGVYDKLLRSINDAINSFLIYIAKDAKNITSRLENLLTKLRWIGSYSLIAIKLMDNHQLWLSFPTGETKIPESVNENLKILKQIEQEIERIKSSSSERNNSMDFLNKIVSARPSTPIKIKK